MTNSIERKCHTKQPEFKDFAPHFLGLVEAGQLTEANQFMQTIISQAPESAKAWECLGMVQCAQLLPHEALESLDKAISLQQDSHLAHGYRARAFGQLLHWKEALAECEYAIQLQPKYADMWEQKAILLTILKRNNQALTAIDHCLKLHIDSVDLRKAQTMILVGLRDYKAALEATESYFTQDILLAKRRVQILLRLRRYRSAWVTYKNYCMPH